MEFWVENVRILTFLILFREGCQDLNERWFAIGVAHDGITVALSGISRALVDVGKSPDDFVGHPIWAPLPPAEQQKSQDALARCIFQNARQTVDTQSSIGGVPQRWRTTFIKCQRPAESLAISELVSDVPALTDAEIRTLTLLVDGEDIHEISRHLGVQESAVNQRLARLRVKLRAKTTAHLAVKAYAMGIR